MLASARRSACSPAPLVGSVAANVSTAGRERMGSFMGGVRRFGGITLETRPALRAPTGDRYDVSGSARVFAFYSTASAFAYVFSRAGTTTLQNVALPCVRPHLRRGRRLARRRHRPWNTLGGHP